MIVTTLFSNKLIADSSSEFKIYYETMKKENISDGLTYEKKSKLTSFGWVDIHVLKMDLTNDLIGLEIIRSNEGFGKLQTLSEMVEPDKQIMGAINASIFNTNTYGSDSQGVEIQGDYTLLSDAYNSEAQGIATFVKKNNGELLMDFLDENVSVTLDAGQEIDIVGINTINDLTYPVVYNRQAYIDSSELDQKARLYKVVVANGIIDKICSPSEIAQIPENGYIITLSESLAPNFLSYFRLGHTITLNIHSEFDQESVELAISGGGKILQSGQLVEPSISITKPNERMARSAIGITMDDRYLIAMVVEGNVQSIGATHSEIAGYLQEVQVDTAMYFTGSSFAEMMIKPSKSSQLEIANQMTNLEEAPSINALAFVNQASVGAISRLEMIPSNNRTFTDMPISVDVIGYDLNNQLVSIFPENITFSHTDVTGNWVGSIFTPSTKGKAKLTCKYGDLSANYLLTVCDEYLDLTLEPSILHVNPLETGRFTVTGTDLEGYKLGTVPHNSNWKVIDPSLGSFVDGQFVSNGKTGTTRITLQMGAREVSATVVVGEQVLSTPIIKNILIKDPLMATSPKSGDFVVSVFGSTVDQDNLLTNIVLEKAYAAMNQANLNIFTGYTKINKNKLKSEYILWNDRYGINDYKNLRVITLATSQGGLADSDGSQWQKISQMLAETAQNNIILVGNESPVNPDGFQDEREGELLHDILSTYQQKTGKNIFYINASGLETSVNFYEGIRYIDLNGLANTIQPGNKVDLYNSYYTVEFYIDQNTLKYQMKNLYPKVEIKNTQ